MISDHKIRWRLKPAIWLLSLAPLVWLAWLALYGGLGANPIEFTNRYLGDWAIRMLLLALAATPLRLLTGWNQVLLLRRLLGLFAFFYATLHLSSYICLDQFFDWAEIWKDILKRNYITVGIINFVILLALAVTSTAGMVRRLGGRRWIRLHKLVYVAGLGSAVHFVMMRKGFQIEPLVYGAVTVALLAARAGVTLKSTPKGS